MGPASFHKHPVLTIIMVDANHHHSSAIQIIIALTGFLLNPFLYMKSHLSKIFISIIALVTFSCTEPRWLTITTRLDIPLTDRPVSPGEGHIWIQGDWFWNGSTYMWRDGYWSRPAPRLHYTPGRWKPGGNGWYWKPGRWRR